MEILKILRLIVLAISFFMFCYQFSTASMNLMDPPMVDSTYEKDISDVDKPLILVCPTNQLYDDHFDKFGYSNLENLLKGNTYCENETPCFSWGGHLNLTFDELKTKAFDLNVVDNIYIFQKDGGYITGNATIFIPGYGLCKEISYFNISQQLYMSALYDSRVFITDNNYTSSFMPDISTHVGSKLFISFPRVIYIDVRR